MDKLSCVYCPPDMHVNPTRMYILDGCSVCESCLRKIQTNYEESGEGYRPLGNNVNLDDVLKPYSHNPPGGVGATARYLTGHLTGLTMKLFNEDGVCLMSSNINSPVINGDSIQFPPIQISL